MPHYSQTKNWTDENGRRDEEILRKMAAEGYPPSVISNALGRSRNSIIGHAHRKNIKLGQRATHTQLDLPPPVDRRKEPRVKPRPVVPYIVPVKQTYENNRRGVKPLDVKPNQCCWPIGNPSDNDFCYCGFPTVEKKPYCVGHCSVAFQVTKPTITSYPN